MVQLALSLLGRFEATLGDQPLISFRSSKVQGLLIYLALHPQQAYGRDVLATMFWPDEPEASATHNLRQSLYRLRRLLGDDDAQEQPFLLVSRAAVQWNPGRMPHLDIAEFARALEGKELETAVARYQGELLPGFSCDSQPFEDWLRAERERLHRSALAALTELTAQKITRGDYPSAQRLARQQLALEPWREEAHRQLMEVLALLGDRSRALAQYESCRGVLAEALGIEPAAATQALAGRIRRQELSQQAQPQSDRPRRLTTPFVGRHREFEALVQAYRRTTRGALQVVTLEGNAGMGKTRLAQQFLAWATAQGADVMAGVAFETSAGLSYQPLTHLLRERIEQENAPDDLLSDLWLSQLTRLLPELRERYPDLPEPTLDENMGRQHLFEAITRLGQALAARRPLVLFIDDWHWADTASQDVLHYAAQRWMEASAPILVLLALRQEALTELSQAQAWLGQLKRTHSVMQLRLDALSHDETAQLVDTLLASGAGGAERERIDAAARPALTEFGDWLFTQTNGQPLFLAEALKVLAEDAVVHPEPRATSMAGPTVWQLDWSRFDAQRAESRILAGVAEIIQSWLTRLTKPAVDLLKATAVLAQAASFEHLCRLTGLDELQAVTGLEELLERQLLLEVKDTADPVYAFSHQKVSEVVYHEVGTARRRLLHRRAFELLQTTALPAASLAYHAGSAGLLAQTIRYSLIAANDAMSLYALRVAIPHFETAWQLASTQGWPAELSGADRQALCDGLGRAYELANERTKAAEIYRAMLSYAESVASEVLECQALNRLATLTQGPFNDGREATVLLARALALAKKSEDQSAVAETTWNLAMAAFQNQDQSLALQYAEQALTISRSLDHPQSMARHLSILSYIYLRRLEWATVEAYASEASRLYTRDGNLVLAADSLRVAGYSQMLIGKPHESMATLEETAAFSRQIENLWGETECAWKLALVKLELGQYGQALALSRQALALCPKLGIIEMSELSLCAWGTVQRTLMALDPARVTFLDELVSSPDHNLMPILLDWALAEVCATHALAGNWREAHGVARQRLQARGDEALLSMGLTGWYETEALLRGGDGDLARAEVQQLGELVGNNKRYRLILLRSQAVLAQWDGEVAQAIDHLQAALNLAQEIGLPGEAWPILRELGGLNAEQGAVAPAREAYQQAARVIHELAETIGDMALRGGFLAAQLVRQTLERSSSFTKHEPDAASR